MNNLLIIGSNSRISKKYLSLYAKDYDNIFGVDIGVGIDSKFMKNVGFIEIRDTNSKFYSRLKKEKIKFSKILFCSGVNFQNDFYTLTKEDWNLTIDVNLTEFLFLLKKMYDFFSEKVSIVAIASQNGVVAHEKRIDYGVSKAALIHLVKELSVDFSINDKKDIRVNAISPSYIINEENKEYFTSCEGKKMLQKIPYKKFVTNEDVAEAIDFLLSDKSKAVRGHNLIIDYGYTII